MRLFQNILVNTNEGKNCEIDSYICHKFCHLFHGWMDEHTNYFVNLYVVPMDVGSTKINFSKTSFWSFLSWLCFSVNFWSTDQILRERRKSLVLEDPITTSSMKWKIQSIKVTRKKKCMSTLFQKRMVGSEKMPFFLYKRTFVGEC